MIDVILRYLDYDTMKQQLGAMGLQVNVAEEGSTLGVEGEFGLVNTPVLETKTGKVFNMRMSDADAAILDDYIDPPDVLCDWRSDEGYEVDGSLVQFDKPIYSSDSVDEDGQPIVVEKQAGVIF